LIAPSIKKVETTPFVRVEGERGGERERERGRLIPIVIKKFLEYFLDKAIDGYV
jgi:hypothetical protein